MRKSPQELERAVSELISDVSSDLLLIHTDITRLGASVGARSKSEALHILVETLERAAAGRTIVFPTFNYDYCRTGIYDPAGDPCQVGILNEFFRQHRAALRTLTPVFNFAASDERLPPEASANPFGETSTFAHLRRCNATVVFLGARFESNTFLHHVEEVVSVGYRYPKPFPGIIRDRGTVVPFTLHYRVRPLQDDIVTYDWPRLESELREAGILRATSASGTELLAYQGRSLADFWGDRLASDEMYLLTPRSAEAVRRLSEQVGYPFRLENLENDR